MLDNNSKAKVLHIYKNNIFLFIYDLKTTTQSKFSNFGLYNISNFWIETKVAIKL